MYAGALWSHSHDVLQRWPVFVQDQWQQPQHCLVVVRVCLSVCLSISTRWQAFSIGNLHGHEECNILFGLNDAIF